MDDRLWMYKYHRTSGNGFNWLIYRFLIADNQLRHLFDLNAYCGSITFITFIFAVIMAVCSIMCLSAVTSHDTLFRDLLEEAEKKSPRMESVVSVVPPYKCIRKHLQRMRVFEKKMEKTLCKEHLELEIMNSKMSCIEKLLKPEQQSEWRRSRSPKAYHRAIDVEVTQNEK